MNNLKNANINPNSKHLLIIHKQHTNTIENELTMTSKGNKKIFIIPRGSL